MKDTKAGRSAEQKPFPGFDKLFALEDPPTDIAFRADIDIDDARALTRGELCVSTPVHLRWAMGRRTPSDVIFTRLFGGIIVHERVVRLLEEHRFTGWTTYPVEVCGQDGQHIPGYHGLAITGRCGPIDRDRSVVKLKQFPAKMARVWVGLYFDPATWDGSDMFMPADFDCVFVAEQVWKAFRRARVKNVQFTRLDQVERLFR